MTRILMRCRHFLLTILLLTMQVAAFAQTAAVASPDMAVGLRASGKIYVVILVLATIFAGIIAFLIYLERRISRLEHDLHREA